VYIYYRGILVSIREIGPYEWQLIKYVCTQKQLFYTSYAYFARDILKSITFYVYKRVMLVVIIC